MAYVSTKRNLALVVMAYFSLLHKTKAMAINIKRSRREAGGRDAKNLYDRFTRYSPAKISYYGTYPAGTSSCSLDPIPPLLSDKKWVLAAVSKEDFLDSLICGTCLRVAVIDLAAREDPDDIFAAVVDQCNDCRKGEISLYTDVKESRKANFEAVDCSGSFPGPLMIRSQSVDRNLTKLQIKNSLLPVVALECFVDGKWKCLQRQTDNHFLLEEFTPDIAMQLRVTSITGEKIGFTWEGKKLNKEIKLSHQFLPFHSVASVGRNVSVPCQDRGNVEKLTPDGLGQRSKPFLHEHVNISKVQDEMNHENKTNGKSSRSRNATKEIDASHSHLNSSFCKGKADGTYLHENDCEKFILCVQSKTLSKKCPNRMRYNAKEGVCDWPSNVLCGQVYAGRSGTAQEDTASVNDSDDEVYTKKFIGRLRWNETMISMVEN